MTGKVQALSQFAPRLVKLIGGEAMQSAFHLGLNLALLHAVEPYQYGIFTLLMVLGGLGLTYIRSLTALPASVAIALRHGRAADTHEIGYGTAALTLALLFGGGVTLALAAWLEEGALDGGLFVGLWIFRSHLRTVFFARGRERIVSLSDLCFTLSGALGAVAAILNGGSHVLDRIFFAMILANAVGIAVLFVFGHLRLRLDRGRRLWRRYRAIWPVLRWSLISVTITNIQGQGMALMVGAFAGPAAYAPIAAALVVFMPLRVIAAGFGNMLHPELSALAMKGDTARIRALMRHWSIPLVIFALAYLGAALLVMPTILPAAFEQSPFYRKGIAAWVIVGMPLLYVLPRIYLEAIDDHRSIASLSAISAALGLSMVALILLTSPPAWAIAGGAFSEIIVLVGTWRIALKRLAENSGRSIPPRASAADVAQPKA